MAMEERGGGDLLEWLGPDLSAAVLRCLDDPADLVRSASVSKSWRRFVITTGFCRKLCLRMIPEISCFVRAIEVGGLANTVEFGPNYSGQWRKLESEHRIYAYLGYHIVSPKFLTEISVESIAASSNNRIENMLPNNTYMLSSYWSSKGKNMPTFRLSCKLCVVHEIKIQLLQVRYFCKCTCLPVVNLRFRLGHMRDENVTPEELLAGNFIWTYVSPVFSMIETDDFQSLKLQRPVICFGGVLQIELLSTDPSVKLPYIRTSQVEAVACPLAPAFDASLLDRMGNSILMYFPGATHYLEDGAVQEPSCSSRCRPWTKTKRRRKNH